MPRARVGEIELEYELHGEGGDPLMLIMGIGAQLILWPDALVDDLVARGFQVVRFDNRDSGKSTWLDHAPVPDPKKTLPRAWLGLPVDVPYTLSDMAADAVGLMDHLGWDRAHVVGASMGGMIAQHLAIEHPTRVKSLASIMSTTGGRLASIPKPRALSALLSSRAQTVEEAEEWFLRFRDVVGGPAYAEDDALARQLARRSFERGANPKGFLRQFGAILASGDRTAGLRNVKAPTVVLHGTHDPLVPPKGGKDTARAIPDARLHLIEGWGHSLPPGVLSLLAEQVTANAKRA